MTPPNTDHTDSDMNVSIKSDTDPLEAIDTKQLLISIVEQYSYKDSDVIADELLKLIQQEKKEAERLGREAMQRMYEKELKMHRTFMANVLARENLKTEKTLAVCDVCTDKLIHPPNTEQEQS